METRYIYPTAVLDIADQSYFADCEVDLIECPDANYVISFLTGGRHSLTVCCFSLCLTFSDEKSLMAFELSFVGPATAERPTAFAQDNVAPLSPEAESGIRLHIAQLQAEARRDRINKTEEELSARSGRHEGDE